MTGIDLDITCHLSLVKYREEVRQMQLSQEERETLAEAAKALTEVARESFDHFREVLSLTGRPIHYQWSNRLTVSAGKVNWNGGYFLIKLSSPIFLHMALRESLPKAEEAVKRTMMHELCHVSRSGRRTNGHGLEWRQNVRRCGYVPSEEHYHSYTCRGTLFGADDFWLGQTVEFRGKGQWLEGVIIKKNIKRAKVRVADGTVWAVPYRTLE